MTFTLEDRVREACGSHGDLPLVRAPGSVNLIGDDHKDDSRSPVLPMAIQRETRILFRSRPDRAVSLKSANRFPAREFLIEPAVRGIEALIAGDIPCDAGLRSSLALVVASALALLMSAGIEAEVKKLMQMLAMGESYVGTRGGGMDQAMCLGTTRDTALRIEFSPYRIEPVPIPVGWSFIIADSLATAAKSSEVTEWFNAIRARCDEAFHLVVSRTAFEAVVPSYPQLPARFLLSSLLQAADATLCSPLHECFRHVVTEAPRVDQAMVAMLCGNLTHLGELMIRSRESLRADLKVRCSELDDLVAACLHEGAAGVRATGAGFGSCGVALFWKSHAGDQMRFLEGHYFDQKPKRAALPDYLLAAEPNKGAGLGW